MPDQSPHTEPNRPPAQQAMLARVAEGDEQAFAQLVRDYGDTIYSQSLAFVKSVPQAEELTQDIFMKVWRNRAKLTSVDHFENWLFILARNMIFDSFKVKVASPLEFTGSEGGVELLTPDLQTEQRDTYSSCSRASSNYRENASRCSA